MALADITTTGWILALLKRDDGQTLLLGSGAYDFKESQQHFAPNTYANDVVELQGTDGQLLTGQVRRSTAQSFDGFVGEAGMTRAEIEQYRRQFLMFFRRGHKYTVIYIFPDGTAIKRDRGYIVDAPSVPELYQILPEYHVALAFEDVNYYSYAEDSSGNETFAFNAHLNLSDVQGGGLKWDANGAISSPTGLGNIRINGDTYQQSYTGKNCYIVANTSSRDIVETVNDDGTFNLVGTASANAYLINYSPLALMENGATYTWWTNLDNLPSGLEFRLAAAKDNSWVRNMTSPMSSTNVSRTFTANTTGDVDQIRCEIWVKSGTTLDLHNIQIQLEKSATKTDFEPYVGGPSPNPEYPQQIQTVTGEQTVTVIVGKNLFNKNNVVNGIPQAADGSIGQISGKGRTCEFIPVLPSTQYTHSGHPKGWAVVAFYRADKSFIQRAGDVTTITTPSDCAYASVSCSVENLDTCQFELGSTATAYTPYHATSYPINLGKNLFDRDTAGYGNILADGTINDNTSYVRSGYIPISPNSVYTLSASFPSGFTTDTYIRMAFYDANKNFISRPSTQGTLTATSPSNACYCMIAMRQEAENIQLEAGSQASAYAPYFTPIELCKLSTYQDYIYKDGENWKVHKAIGKFVVTDNTPTTWDASTPRLYIDTPSLTSLGVHPVFPTNTDELPTAINARFVSKTFKNFYKNSQSDGFAMSPTGKNFNFGKKTWQDSTSARAELYGNITYYAIDAGYITDTTITDQTLIAQLNAIEEAMGADGQPTAIVPTGDNLAAIITGEPNGTGGYEWEASEGGGPTFITVTGIDDAQPVWKVVGPATNPTLTNSTSGVSITWNGTVPSGQTLIVDMGAQTATLEGANVFAFISGSWLTLEPGTNRIAYTAANTTNGCNIYWNEIVG